MVIPIYPDIAALKAVHVLIDYLNETSSIVSKTSFILNNLFAREILKLRDVENGLGAKIALDLPYDPFLYQKAVNEGDPARSRSGPDRDRRAIRPDRRAGLRRAGHAGPRRRPGAGRGSQVRWACSAADAEAGQATVAGRPATPARASRPRKPVTYGATRRRTISTRMISGGRRRIGIARKNASSGVITGRAIVE